MKGWSGCPGGYLRWRRLWAAGDSLLVDEENGRGGRCWRSCAGILGFAHELIIVLPGVVLILEWIKFKDVSRGVRSLAVWVVAGVLWLGLRLIVSGGLLPPYTQGATIRDSIVLRFVKVLGRCFLPPAENSRMMMIIFAGVVVLVGVVIVVVWRRRLWSWLVLGIGFMLALLPAQAVGGEHANVGVRPAFVFSVAFSVCWGARRYFCCRRRWRLLVGGGYVVAGVLLITRITGVGYLHRGRRNPR